MPNARLLIAQEFCPLGEGMVNFKAVFGYLREVGFAAPSTSTTSTTICSEPTSARGR